MQGCCNPLNGRRSVKDRIDKNMEASAAAAVDRPQQALISMQSCCNLMNEFFQAEACSNFYYANSASYKSCDGCRKSGKNCWYAEALPSLPFFLCAEAVSSPQHYEALLPCAVGEKIRKESRTITFGPTVTYGIESLDGCTNKPNNVKNKEYKHTERIRNLDSVVEAKRAHLRAVLWHEKCSA